MEKEFFPVYLIHTQGNLPITEPGLSHTDLGTCTPRQLSRACFLYKMDMEKIWNTYGPWNRNSMFKLFKAWIMAIVP